MEKGTRKTEAEIAVKLANSASLSGISLRHSFYKNAATIADSASSPFSFWPDSLWPNMQRVSETGRLPRPSMVAIAITTTNS